MVDNPLSRSAPGLDLVQQARATIAVFVTLAGVACGITMLYMGMRAVMGVGGFCAEGGPYVIETPCPQGVPLLVMGGIWGGIIFYGLYVWQAIKHEIPSFIALGWSALFLSLGWNFLDFGLDPPGPGGGLVWGWLICAILFGLMGGLPLLAIGKPLYRGFFADPGSEPGTPSTVVPGSVQTTARVVRERARAKRPSASTASAPSERAAGSGIVDELERLAALHRSGALSDAEFEAAKRRLLGDER